jgi:hypothetical protein
MTLNVTATLYQCHGYQYFKQGQYIGRAFAYLQLLLRGIMRNDGCASK